jgi:hypothetical protein
MEKKEIVELIEEIVWKYDVSYLDAVIMFSEKHSIEIETLAGVISSLPMLRENIYKDAEKINLVKKETRIDDSL